MKNNYYTIHKNKKKRKFIGFGKFLTIEKKLKAIKFFAVNIPDSLKKEKDLFAYILTPVGVKKVKVYQFVKEEATEKEKSAWKMHFSN